MRLKVFQALLISVFIFQFFSVSGQAREEKPKSPFWSKVYLGGNLGAQFGNVTAIDVSPIVGYKITEKISAGFGITYQYYNIRAYNYDTHIYGGRLFARYQPWSFLFLQTEFEELSWKPFYDINGNLNSERIWAPGFLAGGGFSQPIGGSSSIFVMGLYNFLYSSNSPYGSPLVLRIGANFGL